MFSYDVIPTKGHRATVVEAECYDFMTKEFVTAKGEAIRHPDDKNDDELAVTLATARALSSLGRKLQKRANGRIKCNDDNARKAEVSKEEIDRSASTPEKMLFTEGGYERCQATKVNGEQCSLRSKVGSSFCGHHF